LLHAWVVISLEDLWLNKKLNKKCYLNEVEAYFVKFTEIRFISRWFMLCLKELTFFSLICSASLSASEDGNLSVYILKCRDLVSCRCCKRLFKISRHQKNKWKCLTEIKHYTYDDNWSTLCPCEMLICIDNFREILLSFVI